MNKLNQRERFVVLIIEFGLLCLGSWMAFSVWFPPIDQRGFWFYTALFGLIMGSRLDTPYYVKPVDVILYAAPAILGLMAVVNWTHWIEAEKIAFALALTYCVLTIAFSTLAVLTFDLKSSIAQRWSATYKEIAQMMGTPRAFFSVLMVFAVFTFHRHVSKEVLSILLTWIAVAAFSPLEATWRLLARVRALFSGRSLEEPAGELVAAQDPGVYLVRQAKGRVLKPGDVLAVNDPVEGVRLGLVLNHVGRDHGQLARVVRLDTEPNETDLNKLKQVPTGKVVAINGDNAQRNQLVAEAEYLVGVVARETTLEKLYIETIPDSDITEGRLVQTNIGGKPVLYQVIDGVAKEEQVMDKNTFGFARAQAQKIGCWNTEKKKFELVKWLPNLNATVQLVEPEKATVDPFAVGHFPETAYTVSIKDINALVTHNTAILGILGVGKSMLAIELVERMMAEGIKVICIDLTNDYSKHLSDFVDLVRDEALVKGLDEIGQKGKDAVSLNVEEGGSRKEFQERLAKEIDDFVAATDGTKLRVLNPSQFDVWRQDSKPYSGKASMASLTPAEITQIISETALAATMKLGTTDKARVCIIYEEAHSLVPEWNSVVADGDRSAANGTARAILQGRKYGLGCLLITQRTANVTKTILNQCNTVFAMRSFDATGMDFLANYIGGEYANTLSTLPERHAIFFGKASSCENPVMIRLNDRANFLAAFRPTHPPPTNAISPQTTTADSESDPDDDNNLPF